MASPFKLTFAKIPEAGLILVIVVLGVLISLRGGNVEREIPVTQANGEETTVTETHNKFFNVDNLAELSKNTSFIALMAIGMTIVIVTGGIDLSVGAIYALSAVSGALVMKSFPEGSVVGAIIGIVVTICTGFLCGWLNGAMITVFRLHPFIITLGTMAIYRGLAFVLTHGQSITGFPTFFHQLIQPDFLGSLQLIPLFVTIVLCIVATIFLNRTAIGRKFYAIGGNETASLYSGIRVERIKLLAYILSGTSAGIAAMLAMGCYGAASSGDGDGYELFVIAAAVVGGASLVGGKGSALGAVLGALIREMIESGITITEIPQEFSRIVTGAVVIVAVLLDRINQQLNDRRLLARTARIKKEVVEVDHATAPNSASATANPTRK